ncbi:MAG: methyltransferase domain-containing protein [Pseudonocardiales bacterium]|nr:methyltransferase domain-containing protein [Pseudonocardiales bacterium]
MRFHRIERFARWLMRLTRRSAGAVEIEIMLATIDRAGRWLPVRVACLERSLAVAPGDTMTASYPLVAQAADLIDYDSYVLEPDGSMLPQSSARSGILRMLRLLEVEPGMRVLEVGAGSGYTSALLGQIVGERGTVTSLDVAHHLVARAARKHAERGARNVAVYPADGFGGWETGAPYDRIIGWTTPHVLPHSWVRQVRDQAVIVTPVKVAPIANANMILRVDIQHRRPIARDVHLGGYIEMHAEVITDFPVPVRYLDGLLRLPQGVVWVSAPELRAQPDLTDRAVRLIATGRAVASPLAGKHPRAVGACHAYLLASRPEGLASAGIGDHWGLGVVHSDSAAVLRHTDLHVAGTAGAEDQLCALLSEWEDAGRPDHTSLEPHLTAGPDGFGVNLKRR